MTSDHVASFVNVVNSHLNKAKWLLQDAATQSMMESRKSNKNAKMRAADAALENIERSQRGLLRWLQYIGQLHLIEDFNRITVASNPEMYNTVKETLVQAHAELERAIAAGDAFLDDPKTSNREAKGLDQIIDAMDDASEPLEAFL